jgi:hypothetical protein
MKFFIKILIKAWNPKILFVYLGINKKNNIRIIKMNNFKNINKRWLELSKANSIHLFTVGLYSIQPPFDPKLGKI